MSMNKEFYINNRKKFAEKLKDSSIAVFFSRKQSRENSDLLYRHSVDRNFYYLTGISREDMVLTIAKVNGEVKETLYIPPINELLEKFIGKFMKKEEAKEISGIKTVLDRSEFEKNFELSVTYKDFIDNLYIVPYIKEYGENLSEIRVFAKRVKEELPEINIINGLSIMVELRSHKQSKEIEEIRNAIALTKDALDYTVKKIKPGMYEYEARAHFEYILSLKGSRIGFDTIVAAGSNATILHYWDPVNKLKDGDMILFDLGGLSKYYSADISRTYPVNGKFTDRQKELYNIVLEAQEIAIDVIKPGILETEVNKKVVEFYQKALKAAKVIKVDSDVSKYYYHGIGHPLGLDVHDLRRKDKTVHENNVYTIEPGLYIEEEGIGIRIEDNFLVTKNGVENLSKDIIKTVDEIEIFMGA